MLVDIYPFNFSDSSFWENAVSTLVGTLTALLVFWLGTWWDKRKDKTKSRAEDLNNMRYLFSLVRGISGFTKTQKEGYYEHSKHILADPTERHLVKMAIVEDLYRVLQRDNHSKLYHSFLAIYGTSQENTDRFYKLFSNLDFLKAVFEQATEGQKLYLERHHEQMVQYRELVEDRIMPQCIILMTTLQQQISEYATNPVYLAIDRAFNRYYTQHTGSSNLKHLHENYLIPLREDLLKNLNNTLVGGLLEECRKASYLYNDVIFHANNIAQEFKIYGDGFAQSETNLDSYLSLLDRKIFI